MASIVENVIRKGPVLYGTPRKKVYISYRTIIRSTIIVQYVLSYFLHTCIRIVPEYVRTFYLVCT